MQDDAGEPNGAAAPGAKPAQAQDNTVQEVGIKVLVGQHKPFYSSEIDIEVDKNDTGPKVKPFIKLNFTYKSNEKAKKMEVLFKETFNKVLELIGEE